MGYRELNEIVNSLPDSFREELRAMVRTKGFDQYEIHDLLNIIRSKTIFDDLFDYISRIINLQDELNELQEQLEEMPDIISENVRYKATIEQLKSEIEVLKENPLYRAKRVKNFIDIFYDANNRFPTFDEVWKQAQMEAIEKVT